MTATLERRKEVLALSREHDFIILEGSSMGFKTGFSCSCRKDDPYYYLYYGKALYSRLQAIKAVVDPDDVFSNPQSIEA